MANKLANYIEGAYYVWTTPGFSANSVPITEKRKNPHRPAEFDVTPYVTNTYDTILTPQTVHSGEQKILRDVNAYRIMT